MITKKTKKKAKKKAKKIAGSIHSELRCALKHLVLRLKVRYGISEKDLRIAEAFVDWMDKTPAARKALKSLGVPWINGIMPTFDTVPF